MIALIVGCMCTTTFSAGAAAEDPAHGGYVLNTSPANLLGAHNDRMLVLFGVKVEFKRYFLVGLLSQCMTVATDVSGGVRYDLRDTGHQRTLIIP